MNIQDRKLDDVTILDLDGTFALGGHAKFRQHIETIIDSGSRQLLINLAKVSYMDSSGLGELISGYMQMQGVGGQMKLLNLNNRLHQLLVVTKLVTLFEMFDSEAAALSSFSAEAKRSAELQSAAEAAMPSH
jgi:anti-sigma B factor antagonist